MNRSFRGSESLMPSIRPRVPQLKSLHSSTTMREKEDDLALFLEMRKREKEKNDLLLPDSKELDESLVSESGNSPLFNIPPNSAPRKTGPDEFLNSESDKNDYDWLLTPPGTPLFPSLDMDSRKAYMDEGEIPKAQPTPLRSRLGNSQTETTGRNSVMPRQSTASTGLNSSVSGMWRPSSSGGPGSRPPSSRGPGSRPPSSGGVGSRPLSSGGPGSRPVTPGGGSRPATPTGRPTSTSSKPSRSSTPTSRGTMSSSKPGLHSSSPKPSNSSTSIRSTASVSSTKSAGPSRSSTPTRSTKPSAPSSTGQSRSSTPSRPTARSATPTRPTARSSTPTARPTVPTSRPTSRASTPTRRTSTPSNVHSATASLNKSSSSISSKSAGSAASRNPGPSRGASPTVRSRPWNPSEMPGFSLDAPPNLRTTVPDRPLSAARGRPAAPSPRSASVEPVSNGRQRRQSCSPSRGRAPNGGIHASGSSVPAGDRGHSKVNDVSPVIIGNKMVERVINMRKLAPPKQDDKHSPSLSGKSASSPDSSGFGRSISKKSLDMAMRHMDIRRTIPGNLRPLMTKIPASSMYSVRSGPAGSRTASVSDSPLATSSNASSEHSVNNHAGQCGHGSELEDDLASERGGQASPTIAHDR